MTIVVGYLPTPEGSAAVDHAMEEARLTSSRVVVVNTGHYGDFAHPNYATAEDIDALDAQLTAAGLDHEIHRSLESTSAAEAILQTATDAGLGSCFIGVPPDRDASVRAAFGIPDDHDPVGVVTIGHRAEGEHSSGSPRSRSRRDLGDLVHRGRWGG